MIEVRNLAVDLEGLGAEVEPEVVVPADVAGAASGPVAAGRRRLAVGVADLVAFGAGLRRVGLDLLGLFPGQEQVVAVLLRPLQRGQRGRVVVAGQIGSAAGGAFDLFLGRQGRRGDQQQDNRGQGRGDFGSHAVFSRV